MNHETGMLRNCGGTPEEFERVLKDHPGQFLDAPQAQSAPPVAATVTVPVPNLEEIKRAVEVIVGSSGRIVEVRAPLTPLGTRSGYYNNGAALAQDVFDLSSDETTPNTYWTIHELDPALFDAGRGNNLYSNVSETTKAGMVTRYLQLPIDCDPVRKPHLSSTDEEKALALHVAYRIQEFLKARGINSILADSGNGYHVLVPLDIPNRNGINRLVEKVLKALNVRFGTPFVKIDVSIFDPSRILKIYGSVARKGPHTDERPWRVSRLLDVPSDLRPLSEEELKRLLNEILNDLPKEKQIKVNEREKYVLPTSGTQITEERNNAVRDYAWHVWYNQTTETPDVRDLKAKVYQFNQEFCVPPLDQSELDRTVLSSTPKKQRAVDCRVIFPPAQPVVPPAPTSAPPARTTLEQEKTKAEIERVQKAREEEIRFNWRDHFRTIGELRTGQIPMLIENFMPGGVTLFGGLPGETKTWVALSACKALTVTRSFLGRFHVPDIVPVIYLIPESGDEAFRTRCEKMDLPNDENLFLCRTISEGSMLLSSPFLIEGVRQRRPLVVIDTLIRFSEAESENEAMQNKQLVNDMTVLRQNGAVGVLALHHATKALRRDEICLENVLRGTGDIAASADCVWGLRRDSALWDQSNGPEEIDLVCVKPRDMNPAPLPFRIALTRRIERKMKPVPGMKEGGLIVGIAPGLESVIDTTGDIQICHNTAKQEKREAERKRDAQLVELVTADPTITLEQLEEKTEIPATSVGRLLKKAGWHKPKGGAKSGSVWKKKSVFEEKPSETDSEIADAESAKPG
jgi:hypothetical protein